MCAFHKGHGSFGSVRKATRLSDQKKVAIKIIQKKTVKGHFDMVHTEMSVMQGLDHPNVIGFYDWFESRYVMELAISEGEGHCNNIRSFRDKFYMVFELYDHILSCLSFEKEREADMN